METILMFKKCENAWFGGVWWQYSAQNGYMLAFCLQSRCMAN